MYRVLIVEDEPGFIFSYQCMNAWEKCGFMIVDTAEHGAEAISKYEKEKYDLIFTDISMPIVDGVEMLQRLRKKGYTDLTVIFASSHSDFNYAQKGIEYGVFDYIVKPVKEEMLEKVLLRTKEHLDSLQINKIDKVMIDLLTSLGLDCENDNFLRQIAEYCSKHYKENLVADDFADVFSYSADHFRRIFHKSTGLNFKDFYQIVKIAYAIELLRAGTYTVSEISEHLGYSDDRYFRRIFKSVTGDSPSEYKFGKSEKTDRSKNEGGDDK